jgi:hypothetical protein
MLFDMAKSECAWIRIPPGTMWRPAAYGILSCSVSYFKNAVLKRRVLQGGELSLSLPWNLQLVNQNLYLDIMTVFMHKVWREKGALSTCPPKKEIEKSEQCFFRQWSELQSLAELHTSVARSQQAFTATPAQNHGHLATFHGHKIVQYDYIHGHFNKEN